MITCALLAGLVIRIDDLVKFVPSARSNGLDSLVRASLVLYVAA